MQGIRKGYRDSQIVETFIIPEDVFDPTISPSVHSSAAQSFRLNGIALLGKLCSIILLIDAVVGIK